MEPVPLSIRLFGGFGVRVRGQPLPRLRTRSVEWLLALLVLRHGRPVPRAWLAGTLWLESSGDRALRNLRRDLYRGAAMLKRPSSESCEPAAAPGLLKPAGCAIIR
jgi:DNA-binding SARP family transcriptional activator